MDKDLRETTTTSLNTSIGNFTVGNVTLQSPGMSQAETYYNNPYFNTYHAYYRTIPEFKSTIDSLMTYAFGKGWTADDHTTNILGIISGNGKKSFAQIIQGLGAIKLFNGDAYAQIVRHDNIIINLKPLNPSRVRVVYDNQGMIKEYLYLGYDLKTTQKTINKSDMFHIMNDPIGDEIHGVSVLESCKWALDAKNEAMTDWRRISHRSTIRVLYIDSDDTTKLTQVRNQYKEGIKNGEVLIIPAKKGEAEFEDLQLPPVEAFMTWIRYLDNFIYQALKVPKVITGGAADYTEAASKVGYMTFDPFYTKQQLDMEADIKNQLGLDIDFIRPVEIGGTMNESEQKNTGQVGMQPSEMQVGKNE